ncbi:MAG: YbaN family protein [Tissierellales bacterium]|nr:YbaN family protein [Tissierellales bacterium]
MKIFLIVVGTVSLSLGIIGIPLPILPTTPFLLLSAACYIRSSDKLYDWLINHQYLGKYIKNYRENHSIPKKAKVISITTLWLGISISAWLISKLIISVILFIVAIGVTIHIMSFKTI